MPDRFGRGSEIWDALRARTLALPHEGGGNVQGVDPGNLGFGNKIIHFDADGNDLTLYPATQDGLNDALAAANTGDTVWLPSRTIALTTGVVVPADVTVRGIDRDRAVLSGGSVTLGNGSILQDFKITRTANNSNPLYGVIGPGVVGQAATCLGLKVTCTQSGSGDAAGLAIQSGDVETWGCDFEATSAGGSGYGVRVVGGGGGPGGFTTVNSYDGTFSLDSSSDTARPGMPLTDPTGRDCTLPLTCAEIFSPNFGTPAWAIYDLGGDWTGIDQIVVRNYHEGQVLFSISEDKLSWTDVYSATVSWTAGLCQTQTITLIPSENARFIRFQVTQVVLVGDYIELAWFNVRGNAPSTTAYGAGTFYYTRFSGDALDLDAGGGTARVYACQYDSFMGLITPLTVDRSAWDVVQFPYRHANDIDNLESFFIRTDSFFVGDPATSYFAGSFFHHVPSPVGQEGKAPVSDGFGWIPVDIPTQAELNALADEQFVVMAATADLANERVLTAGVGISIIDGGAGAAVMISTAGGEHAHGLTRWISDGDSVFVFPDIVEEIQAVSINGLEESPTLYSLSEDRVNLEFVSSVTAEYEITSQYIIAQVS